MGNHSEAFQVDFDPAVIGYDELCNLFFQGHDPGAEPWSVQYRAAAFPDGDEQRMIAVAAGDRAAQRTGKAVRTAIEDFRDFTLAEDYHQKYRLRHVRPAMEEFVERFGTLGAFLESVAVTKANAMAGGDMTTSQRREGLPRLGLSERGTDAIRSAWSR